MLVGVARLVVKEREPPRAGCVAEVHRHDVGRVTFVLLEAHGVAQRIHGVADHQVRVGEEGLEDVLVFHVVRPVLSIGGVDHRPAVPLEAVAERAAPMPLVDEAHLQSRRLEGLARGVGDELDVGLERVERHRKRDVRLLAAQRVLCILVSGVDDNRRAGLVGRPEEREPHDVVPVQVGQEEMIDARMTLGAAAQGADAELPQAGSHVADDERVFVGLDLDARRRAAKGPVGREFDVGAGELAGLGFARRTGVHGRSPGRVRSG